VTRINVISTELGSRTTQTFRGLYPRFTLELFKEAIVPTMGHAEESEQPEELAFGNHRMPRVSFWYPVSKSDQVLRDCESADGKGADIK
jgi:hypothetical protein